MIKKIIIFSTATLFLLTGCQKKENSVSTEDQVTPVSKPVPFDPVVASNFDELEAYVNESKTIDIDTLSNADENYYLKYLLASHDVKDMDFYYKLTTVPLEAELNGIMVKNKWVKEQYYTHGYGEEESKDEDENALEEVKSSVLLTWHREPKSLEDFSSYTKDMEDSSVEGVKYYQSGLAENIEKKESQSFLWLHDGYMFELTVPISVDVDDIDFDTIVTKVEVS